MLTDQRPSKPCWGGPCLSLADEAYSQGTFQCGGRRPLSGRAINLFAGFRVFLPERYSRSGGERHLRSGLLFRLMCPDGTGRRRPRTPFRLRVNVWHHKTPLLPTERTGCAGRQRSRHLLASRGAGDHRKLVTALQHGAPTRLDGYRLRNPGRLHRPCSPYHPDQP